MYAYYALNIKYFISTYTYNQIYFTFSCFQFDCHIQCFMGLQFFPSLKPSIFKCIYFLFQSKICNSMIYLTAGCFSSWLKALAPKKVSTVVLHFFCWYKFSRTSSAFERCCVKVHTAFQSLKTLLCFLYIQLCLERKNAFCVNDYDIYRQLLITQKACPQCNSNHRTNAVCIKKLYYISTIKFSDFFF